MELVSQATGSADDAASTSEEGVHVDAVDDTDIEQPPRPVWKPDITDLPDAVQKHDGVWTFMLAKGDRILIDYTALPYGSWLDTRCWVIDKVREDGFVGLWDPHAHQYGCTNWRDARKRGLLLKIPGKGDDWKQPRKSALSRKSPMRAAVKAKLEHEAEERAATGEKSPTAEPEKKRRGRPKGSLNARTIERLSAAGYDAATMTREQIDEVMARIRKEMYEAAKAERRRIREQKKAERKESK